MACVVDVHPRFRLELVLWTLCARRALPADRFRLIVYFVGAAPDDLREWLTARSVDVRVIEPVLSGAPHCNKIAPFADADAARWTVCTDTDLFFVEDPSPLFQHDRYRAPPNNHCNPPGSVFADLLAASGLGRPYRPGMALYANSDGIRETHINNISAGLVAAPPGRARPLADAWRTWASWLLDRRPLLRGWDVHLDQAAFALAMESLAEDVDLLPPQVNTILASLGEIATVIAFHLTSAHVPGFPDRWNPDRTLRTTGVADGVAAAIDCLNDRIREATAALRTLPSTRDHLDMFLNPHWSR